MTDPNPTDGATNDAPRWTPVASWSDLPDREPTYALVEGVDLVLIRFDDDVSALYGRCLHRGALLADGHVDGANLICGLHGWDYRYDTGVSEYDNSEALARFPTRVDTSADAVMVDAEEVARWAEAHPQPYDRDTYLGLYQDVHGASEEPYNGHIQRLAREGLSKTGHHGPVSAMGVPLTDLPRWEDLQLLTAQLARTPLRDDDDVDTRTIIGPKSARPLALDIPIFVSDMSFGAISEEAKIALSKGADAAGTGICSGEGGMLPEEQANNRRYFYEYATGRFGWSMDKAKKAQAFHFKAGQGAKTGVGGHLPGAKVTERIADVRGLEPGQDAISPGRFEDLRTPSDFRAFADEVREATGGIPIGFKMSAQHLEKDLDFAFEAGADYVILDGRGGATGAAPDVLKHNISVPTLAALARARRHIDASMQSGVTLIVTGGLRTEADFVKALALGADAIAVANAALQAIGCLGMRACHTNNCPVGIATMKKDLRARLVVEASAARLTRWFEATTELMKVLARACGHTALSDFSADDLTTWKREVADLTGVRWAGVADG
jgi:glutamate synthase domain-containing protein 2